jgi:hypothetical protein
VVLKYHKSFVEENPPMELMYPIPPNSQSSPLIPTVDAARILTLGLLEVEDTPTCE